MNDDTHSGHFESNRHEAGKKCLLLFKVSTLHLFLLKQD